MEKLQSSYYANKIPMYMQDIANGSRVVKTWSQISYILKETLKEFNTNIVVAHNARFDNGVIKTTKQYLSQYAYYYEWWDSLKMARSVVGKMPTYRRFCESNGYLTAKVV